MIGARRFAWRRGFAGRLRRVSVRCLSGIMALCGLAVLVQVAAADTRAQKRQQADGLVCEALQREMYGLLDERQRLLDEALALEPDHAMARWQSGQIGQPGQWSSADEMQEMPRLKKEARSLRADAGQDAGYRAGTTGAGQLVCGEGSASAGASPSESCDPIERRPCRGTFSARIRAWSRRLGPARRPLGSSSLSCRSCRKPAAMVRSAARHPPGTAAAQPAEAGCRPRNACSRSRIRSAIPAIEGLLASDDPPAAHWRSRRSTT